MVPTRGPIIFDKLGPIVTLNEENQNDVQASTFSPDGQIIALSGSSIKLWNVHSQQLVKEMKNPYAPDCSFYEAKFSPDGKYFAASVFSQNTNKDPLGHVLVWDISTGAVLQDWPLEYARMPPTSSTSWEFVIPVYSLAFLPNSTGLVYASGNNLEIRDILQSDKHDVLKLGSKMFASQISTSTDGRLVYVIMSWEKDHDFPAFWTYQHKFQVWNINTHAMLKEVKYPQGWVNFDLQLLGTSLVEVNFSENTSQIRNLETDKVKDMPYREGWRYYNSDGSLMIFYRLFLEDENGKILELWKTDNWRNLYSFSIDFGKYKLGDIVFSPDNSILAVQHEGMVTLWNIAPVVKP
jgi:WD40 repeat protein